MMELLDPILRFMDRGGEILWVIFFVAALLLTLMVERFWFVHIIFPGFQKSIVEEWNGRPGHHTWEAQRIKEALLSQAKLHLEHMMAVIKTLVAMLPMLGLLGTVVGMIHVFDVMALLGTGNARAMASGVSMATIPTMAGMVIAVVGIFFVSRLEYSIKLALSRLQDKLL